MVSFPDNPVSGDRHTENGTTWVYSDPPKSWSVVLSGIHANLQELDADDHPQYLNEERGDARYLRLDGGTVDGDVTFDQYVTFGDAGPEVAQFGDPANGNAQMQVYRSAQYFSFMPRNSGDTGWDFGDSLRYYFTDRRWTIGGSSGSDVVLTQGVGDARYALTGDVISDHGNLDGLADDDHPQYLNETRGDARYLQLTGGNEATGVLGVTVDTGYPFIGRGDTSNFGIRFNDTAGTNRFFVRHTSNNEIQFGMNDGVTEVTYPAYISAAGTAVPRGQTIVTREKGDARYLQPSDGDARYLQLTGGTVSGGVSAESNVTLLSETDQSYIYLRGVDGTSNTGSIYYTDTSQTLIVSAADTSGNGRRWYHFHPSTIPLAGNTVMRRADTDGRYLQLSGGTVTGTLSVTGIIEVARANGQLVNVWRTDASAGNLAGLRFQATTANYFSLQGLEPDGSLLEEVGRIYPAGTSVSNTLTLLTAEKGDARYTPAQISGTFEVQFRDASASAGGGNASPTVGSGQFTRTGDVITFSFAISNVDTTGLVGGNNMYMHFVETSGTGAFVPFADGGGFFPALLTRYTSSGSSLIHAICQLRGGGDMVVRQISSGSSNTIAKVNQFSDGNSGIQTGGTYLVGEQPV